MNRQLVYIVLVSQVQFLSGCYSFHEQLQSQAFSFEQHVGDFFEAATVLSLAYMQYYRDNCDWPPTLGRLLQHLDKTEASGDQSPPGTTRDILRCLRIFERVETLSVSRETITIRFWVRPSDARCSESNGTVSIEAPHCADTKQPSRNR